VLVGGEQGCQPVLLLGGEQIGPGVQGPPRPVERVVGAAAVTMGVLDASAAAVERVAGEAGSSTATTDRGEIDDHRDELVAAPGVAPDVLIDPDHSDPVEPGGILDQDPRALGEDRVVGGVPRHPEALGDAGDSEVLTHEALQRPPQPTAGDLRPRLRRPGGVLTPDVPAPGTPVAADRELQRRGPPAQRLVRQPTHHGVARHALAPAAAAPLIRFADPTRQHRTRRLEPAPHHLQTQLVEAGERGQVSRASEGSVRHVEVFPVGSVRTPIIGRPRPLPGHRHANPRYTLNCGEPENSLSSKTTRAAARTAAGRVGSAPRASARTVATVASHDVTAEPGGA